MLSRSRLLIAVLLLISCSTPPPVVDTDTVRDLNGELVSHIALEPVTIDPQLVIFPNEIAQASMVFEALMTLDPNTLRPVPAAAARYPVVSDDGLSWTFTLRNGLTYSDGAPLTAANFVYAFTRACDPATGAEEAVLLFLIRGCQAWNDSDPRRASAEDLASARESLGVREISPTEIRFTLVRPAPHFMAITHLPIGMPVRQSDIQRAGPRWTEPATYIGNGPFKLVEWSHGSKLVFERNERYREPAGLARWTRVVIPDQAVAISAYRNGDLDLLELEEPDVPLAETAADLRADLQVAPGRTTFYFGFNTTKPPFNDRILRRAFAMAIDRAAYVRAVEPLAVPATGGFIPPGFPGHDFGDRPEFDPAAARSLLATASPESREQLTGIQIAYIRGERTTARVEWLAREWKEVLGVDVGLLPLLRGEFGALMRDLSAAPALFPLAWSSRVPDQRAWLRDAWLPGVGSAAVITGFQGPGVDGLLQFAESELRRIERDQFYERAGRFISAERAAIWLAYGVRKYVSKPWVQGLRTSPVDVFIGQIGLTDIYVTASRERALSTTR